MEYYNSYKYNNRIPAAVFLKEINSDTRKTALQWHREPELVFVLEGEAECNINGSVELLHEGDLAMLNSGDVHLVRPPDGMSCRVMFVMISPDYIKQYKSAADGLIFDINASEDIKRQITELLIEFSETPDKSEHSVLLQIACINKIYYLLLEYCLCDRRAANSAGLKKSDFSYAKTAISYINENYAQDITLDEISSIVNLSPSYFSKYFKKVTGVSFSEYLANLRLGKAVEDMLTNNTPVSTAALNSGFANVKSFITQCKKVYGCTPAQYKKKLIKRKNIKIKK